ncbi:hypothetical protein Fmac_017206 [Flemingia macrophylla]|uniref:Uncharacterized protein n=1 Tax=Flemingia macrophylla TaxID=520843 RepID=A0ABD1M1G7_9FABA
MLSTIKELILRKQLQFDDFTLYGKYKLPNGGMETTDGGNTCCSLGLDSKSVSRMIKQQHA